MVQGARPDPSRAAGGVAELRAELAELRERAEEGQRVRQLADALPAFVSYIDAAQRYVFLNQYHVGRFRRPAGELCGRTVAEVVGPENYARAKPNLEAALRGERVQIEHAVNLPNGEIMHIDTAYVPDRRADGSIVGCFVMGVDITERKRSEDELRRSRQQLCESDRRKDEFLAMLGHELRNPLAAICTASELLHVHHGDDPILARICEVLDRQSNQMVRLVDGLLDISRIARGKIHLEPKTVELRGVLEGVLHDRREPLTRGGLRLDQQLPDQPLWVWGDEVRLAQIFDNLIGNAIKFTPEAGTVSVIASRRDEWIVVQVKDTGIGIRSDMLDSIFEPFQQDAPEIARATGGLGIGLALVRGLIELHQGTVVARSEGADKGAEFEVRLPIHVDPCVCSPCFSTHE